MIMYKRINCYGKFLFANGKSDASDVFCDLGLLSAKHISVLL